MSTRETARQEVPAPLRKEVRLLGDLLGGVLAGYGGPELLEDVERLRRTVIASREADQDHAAADELVGSWSIDRAEQVARAFTCYFQLVNLAEERHRARALRQRGQDSRPVNESLAETVAQVRSRHGEERLRELLSDLIIQPVLTAHPTESRRRAVVDAISRVDGQLQVIDDPRASASEHREAHRRLREEIEILWRTAQLRSTQPHPLDEVRSVMAVFDESLFGVVPKIYRDLDTALGSSEHGDAPPALPAFIRFGSWVGGDRDGNPAVTAEVTRDAVGIQAEHLLRGLERVVAGIGTHLTVDSETTPPSEELRSRLERHRSQDAERSAEIETRSPSEPHRQYLLHIADRIKATRKAGLDQAYRDRDELLDDLRIVQRSLAAARAERLAYGELQYVLWQVQTFGLHLADLEVRQHSRVHKAALEEVRRAGAVSAVTEDVLETFRAIKSIQDRFGRDACRRYVVSFAHEASDVADVYALAEAASPADSRAAIDVVPLFETVDDLARAPQILDRILELEPVKRALSEGGRLEVMLGYSDSSKEVGPVSANLALYAAQEALVRWSAARRVPLTMFHGRGGAMGRGGGPANRAIRAQAPGSIAGHFKVTEQGEVIFSRYLNPAIAQRHLEQVASAVLMSSLPEVQELAGQAAQRFGPLAARMDRAARAEYRGLVETAGFHEWFNRVSPVEELGRMRLGSRPAYRSRSTSLGELRAIPWVFAWSQMRLNLPGWYGLGTALRAADVEELRQAYAEWPLFNAMLDNAEMSLAKSDRRIAERFLSLGDRPEISARILREYDLTIQRVLEVTGHSRLLERHRVLSWAVELRNPYVDALSHVQLQALHALRRGHVDGAERELWERVLLVAINGVSAGLQNTG